MKIELTKEQIEALNNGDDIVVSAHKKETQKEILGDGIYIESKEDLKKILDEWEPFVDDFIGYLRGLFDFPAIFIIKDGKIVDHDTVGNSYTIDSINEIPLEEFMPKIATKKIKKWEPKGGEWFINSVGVISTEFSLDSNRLFGVKYNTEYQAKKARDIMRKHNRLLAWLSENDDGWVADWDDGSQMKYIIYYQHKDKKYNYTSYTIVQDLCGVYMSKENAEELCEALNNGEIEL